MPTRKPPLDIEIVTSLLPYTDLQINGDPQRNLHLPNDINIVLAGIIGMQGMTPRMAHMSHSGALFVAEAGGGVNDFDGGGLAIGAGAFFTQPLAELASLLYLCAVDSSFSITVTKPPGLQANFKLANGFQVMLPLVVSEMSIQNTGSSLGHINFAGFFHNPTFPQLGLQD